MGGSSSRNGLKSSSSKLAVASGKVEGNIEEDADCGGVGKALERDVVHENDNEQGEKLSSSAR